MKTYLDISCMKAFAVHFCQSSSFPRYPNGLSLPLFHYGGKWAPPQWGPPWLHLKSLIPPSSPPAQPGLPFSCWQERRGPPAWQAIPQMDRSDGPVAGYPPSASPMPWSSHSVLAARSWIWGHSWILRHQRKGHDAKENTTNMQTKIQGEGEENWKSNFINNPKRHTALHQAVFATRQTQGQGGMEPFQVASERQGRERGGEPSGLVTFCWLKPSWTKYGKMLKCVKYR